MSATPEKAGRLRRLASSVRHARDNHRERRSPTGFGFAFADRIDYLDPARWDAVTKGQSVFLRRDILRVIEEHGPENIQPRYAMLFRDDQVVAADLRMIILILLPWYLSIDHAMALFESR